MTMAELETCLPLQYYTSHNDNENYYNDERLQLMLCGNMYKNK